jgi:signal transduction histidine kinase
MWQAVRRAVVGDNSGAVGWLAAGNWMAIFTGAVLAPSVWPIYPVASLLPAVVAASYVRQDEFRRYLLASVTVAAATTMFGLFSRFTSIDDDVPTWVIELLQAVFVPLLTATLGFLALQNFARIRSIVTSLTDAHEAVRFQANDLLASRSRMLAATDRERRRIERDLHDGTQQHFVALSMRLAAVSAQLPPEASAVRDEIDRLRVDVKEAQRDLRDLTAAIYPPTLAQHGLTSAVRFVADRFTDNVSTRISDVGRLEPTVEAAMYFACLEALQNAAKHAGDPAQVTIELGRSEREVWFVVEDDGVGFDITDAMGGGTTNMADRLGAVLGTLTIESEPGVGTRVRGVVPAPAGSGDER